jgi:phosphatidylethanolamine/phosphatidyl-N-methylethanolamine N-methyltransferase
MTAGLTQQTGAVVELGSGTGTITEAILARGVPPERLALFETNRVFAELLQRRFAGVQVLRLDAREIEKAPLEGVGAVISGLPLLSIPTPVQREIVEGAFRLMRPGGVFVQFTYGWRPPVDRPVREALGLEWEVSPWVWANIPPARVYAFRRRA